MLRRHKGCLALLAIASLAGCSKNVYEIEMRPQGDAIERDLTAWREGMENARPAGSPEAKPEDNIQALPHSERQRIAASYGEAVPPERAKKYQFSAEFRGSLPNDVGGAGSFTRWQSPLGDLFVYVERARGNDDLAADLDARRVAVNRAVDILIGWLDGELRDDPMAPKLHALLDGPLRRDANNLLLDAWSTVAALRNLSMESDDEVRHELFFRSAQYLVERQYVAPDDVPGVVRAMDDAGNRGDDRRLLVVARAAVARKLKLDDDAQLDGLFALLADRERVERTLFEHVKTTPEYLQLVARSRSEANRGKLPEKIGVADVFYELLVRTALRLNLFEPADRLRAKLHVAQRPVATNGSYDAERGVVTWDHDIDAADTELPGMPFTMFAAWAEPNEDEQTRRFGKVVLRDESLAKYVFWHRGLTDAERAEWARLLDSLRPGDGLQKRVETFRFEADVDRESNDLAGTPRELLLEAFEQHDLQ